MTVQDIDVRMIKRAARGDSDAFASLFDFEYQHVYRYAMWLCGDADTAEDITQETFIRAHKGLDRLGPPYNIRAWLFRLAHNYYIDVTRRRDPSVPLDPDAPIAAHTPTPEAQITYRELSTGVGMALGRLPTNQREVLVLREIEGLQYSDIAEVLGLSLENVKVMLHRARATFKDHYSVRLLAEDPRPRCEELGALLDSFHDGEPLPLDQERKVREHLKECATCQQRKREIAAIALLLQGLKDPVTPRRIRDRMRRRLGRRRWIGALVIAAALCAALIMGGGFVAAGGLPDIREVIEALDRADRATPAPDASPSATMLDTPTPTDEFAAPPPDDPNTRIVSVWNCQYIGSSVFQWYEARVTFEDQVPVSSEIVNGPYTGEWQPNCPPAPTDPPPAGDTCQNSCGNSVCESETCGEDKVNCPFDCQQCGNVMCGDNVCDAACGEDPNSCANDCP